LKQYVDANWPPVAEDAPGHSFRWLMGRRLVRENRLDDARQYLPTHVQPMFDTYTTNLRFGRDKTKPVIERATALTTAARTMHAHGRTLAGTEGEPDWNALWGGNFTLTPIFEIRTREKEAKPFVTPDELIRAQNPPAQPYKRYHYRYTAAELAWEAATMMPDNSDETARLLNEAGGWLKNRDPQAANRFYVALVKRCRNTELGRLADEKRWFP